MFLTITGISMSAVVATDNLARASLDCLVPNRAKERFFFLPRHLINEEFSYD
jgi:hypothetical protein